MLIVETIAPIRREHFIKGKTIKEIARDLKVLSKPEHCARWPSAPRHWCDMTRNEFSRHSHSQTATAERKDSATALPHPLQLPGRLSNNAHHPTV